MPLWVGWRKESLVITLSKYEHKVFQEPCFQEARLPRNPVLQEALFSQRPCCPRNPAPPEALPHELSCPAHQTSNSLSLCHTVSFDPYFLGLLSQKICQEASGDSPSQWRQETPSLNFVHTHCGRWLTHCGSLGVTRPS